MTENAPLEYGMPEIPWKGEYRWNIKQPDYSPEYRYMHLEKKGRFFWATVHKHMISTTGKYAPPFEQASVEAAEAVLKEVRVNFNLPTGVVI